MTAAAPATLEQARAAKEKLRERMSGISELRGIGIAILDGGYGVKINLACEPEQPIPSEVDGVPVIVSIVGSIVPRTPAS